MGAFAIAAIVTFVLALAGRGSAIVAQFAEGLPRSPALLATAIGSVAAAAMVVVLAGGAVGAIMPPDVRMMAAALAFGLAAIALARAQPVTTMKEPTRSFVAIGVVLFVTSFADAALLALFAFALAARDPAHVAIGGVIGIGAAFALAWRPGAGRGRF